MPSADPLFTLQRFNPADCQVTAGRRLPHWSQAGAVCFITWRTADSLPAAVAEKLVAERIAWRRSNPGATPAEYRKRARWGWENALDCGSGSRPLRDPACAQIVADALRHFDGVRYILLDFVVMPNHVHVLAAFRDSQSMHKCCESWKRFTATRLNRLLDRAGPFWQAESFDHLARSDDHLERLRAYIAANPARAGLSAGESLHYSAPLPECVS